MQELKNPNRNSKIVDAIVSLGRGLELPLTAEGIEDEDILLALRSMGKLKGQGYLYGKPESGEEVLQRLAIAGKLAKEGDTVQANGKLAVLAAGAGAAAAAPAADTPAAAPAGGRRGSTRCTPRS